MGCKPLSYIQGFGSPPKPQCHHVDRHIYVYISPLHTSPSIYHTSGWIKQNEKFSYFGIAPPIQFPSFRGVIYNVSISIRFILIYPSSWLISSPKRMISYLPSSKLT